MRADDVWTPISDALLRGAHHELNNRVASLAAVEQVISASGEATPALREALMSELRRMRGAIDLLGRIPLAAPAPVSPVRAQDLLATAVELVRLHHEMGDVGVEIGCEDGTLPIRVDPAAVQRSLLVMILAAAASPDYGSGGTLRLDCRGDRAVVTITASPADLSEAAAVTISDWLRPSGGRVAPAGPRAFSVELPALGPDPS